MSGTSLLPSQCGEHRHGSFSSVDRRRKTGLVMGPVMHGGKTVEITSSGRVVAQISPRPWGMSGKEFARLWRERPRLGPELAGEILQSIEQMNQADHEAAD